MTNRNNAFDFLKFLGAIIVVFLHCQYPGRDVLNVFVRFAVPLFFLLSGYCVQTQDEKLLKDRLMRGLKKMLNLLFFSTLLYFFVMLPLYIRDGFPDMKSYLMLLLYNEHPFGFHLWYIGSYVYVLAIAYVSVLFNVRKFVLLIFPLLLLVNLFFGEFSPVTLGCTPEHNFYLRNFLLMGLPFFSIGYLMSEYQVGKKTGVSVLPFIGVFVVLTFLERFLLVKEFGVSYGDNVDVFVSPSGLAVLLVLWGSRNDIHLGMMGSKFAEFGRKYSLDIYIFHAMFLILLRMIFKRIQVLEPIYQSMEPVVVFVSTFLFVVFFDRCKRLISKKSL